MSLGWTVHRPLECAPDEWPLVAAAEQVPGWMSRSELIWLLRVARQHQRIIEVGGFVGRSSLVLASATPGRLLTVDTWRGEPQDFPALTGDTLERRWRATMARPLADGKADLFTGTLQQYARARTPGTPKPDCIFIDAKHDPESVRRDCLTAKRLIAPRGLIAGHDWPHEGLADAVRSVFPDARVVVDRIWVANHEVRP